MKTQTRTPLSTLTACTAFAALTAFGVTSASAANLILNPGFEDSSTPTNWTTGGFVKGADLGITPHSGARQLQIQGADTTLYQSVVLDAGNYDLSMWVASRDDVTADLAPFDSGEFQFELRSGGDTGSIVTAASSSSPDYYAPKGTYVQWTRSYTGLTAGTYTVWLTIGDDPTDGGDQGMLDDFSLTLVPEPGSLALMAMGGLCMLRRRRA